HQSAPYVPLLLLVGETSVIFTAGGGGGEVIVPGEPVWSWATKAPLRPATLRVESTGRGALKLPSPAAVAQGKLVVEPPKPTPVRWAPSALKTLTASPPELRPMPEPL